MRGDGAATAGGHGDGSGRGAAARDGACGPGYAAAHRHHGDAAASGSHEAIPATDDDRFGSDASGADDGEPAALARRRLRQHGKRKPAV